MSTFVIVPRGVAAQWWSRPWSDVLAAAQAGTDGLRVYQNADVPMWRPKDKSGVLEPGWDDWDSIAFLRESHVFEGVKRTLLYKQNW